MSVIIKAMHVCSYGFDLLLTLGAGGLRYLLCLSVCLSVTTLAVALFISTIKLRYEGLQLSILFIFNSWIFKKNDSLKSCGVICLP